MVGVSEKRSKSNIQSFSSIICTGRSFFSLDCSQRLLNAKSFQSRHGQCLQINRWCVFIQVSGFTEFCSIVKIFMPWIQANLFQFSSAVASRRARYKSKPACKADESTLKIMFQDLDINREHMFVHNYSKSLMILKKLHSVACG